jgi:hypothetical protein
LFRLLLKGSATLGGMTWQDVLFDKNLQNLPYKIELNARGKIEMSPASNRHGWLQAKIIGLLLQHTGGMVLSECSINTSAGVKVADVVWLSQAFWQVHVFETPFSAAPELCRNHQSKQLEKRNPREG